MPAAFKRIVPVRLRGLTLVELLVVVMVVTLLSAATLPTLRTVMTQRKTSQASILVKNMLEAARARAIARGRPVAVVLERLSSRSDRNPNFRPGDPIAENNFPLQSNIAGNVPAEFEGNYGLYNACIRMSFAESPPPVSFENVTFNMTGNVLEVAGPIGSDSRFAQSVQPGSVLEFPSIPAMHRGLMVVGITPNPFTTPTAPIFYITVDNPPVSTPGAIPNYVNSLVVARQAIKPTIVPTGTFTGASMTVRMLPQPIASQIVDLPKGTCIDLSLSGFASNTRWSSSVGAIQSIIDARDARRHLASDWVWAMPGVNPAPVSLRPVYVVFNSSGVIESVIMNGAAISGAGLPDINKYDVHDDLYLFVGRMDQVFRIEKTAANMTISGTPATPEDLDTVKLKANINDTSSQWVRISPRSGAISVATAASVFETPLPSGAMPMANSFPSVGELLGRSRELSFTDEATAQ